MSEDNFSVRSSQSWVKRIIGALSGAIFGLIMFLGAFPLLFWNEGRAVETYKTLLEGAQEVITVMSERVDSLNEGKLVHVTGEARTENILNDSQFGVSVNAIKLDRRVKMYQWQEDSHTETKKKLGGGTEEITTYTYSKGWSERSINTSSFKKPAGHQNPESFPIKGMGHTASEVSLGDFELPSGMVSQMNQRTALPVEQPETNARFMGQTMHHTGNGYYLGDSPSAPEIGDMDVSFYIVGPAVVSVIARQINNSFEPFRAKAGGEIYMLEYGTQSAQAMIDQAQQDNKILTWILRAVGLVLMFFGLRVMLNVISVIADVLPALGTLAGIGLSLASFLVTVVLSMTTIGIAWVFYRPLLGVSLLAIAGLALYLIRSRMKKVAHAPASVSGNTMPPPAPPA